MQMKTLIVFLCLIAVIAAIYFIPTTHQEVVTLLSYSQCDQPLSYKIGSIDPRFGISQSDVSEDSREATELWSSAEGKNLFTQTAAAKLTVNFVYDERQALDTQIDQLNNKLKENNASLQQQIDDFKTQAASFQQRLDAFNKKVDEYNAQGGAPQDVYPTLVQEQNQLKAEGDRLNARAKELNLSTHDFNTSVSTLNQDINQFNSALAKKPEEGLYNGGDNTITIYFASNRQELLHTLTHEFGHALGMDHVTDPEAIMYPFTTKSLTVTDDDKKQLAYVCREQSSIMHYAQQFDLWLIDQLKSRGLIKI
jgi:hypothetical protein